VIWVRRVCRSGWAEVWVEPRRRSTFWRARSRSFGVDGLEEVVDGVHAEGLERVLVVRGGEDDDGLGGQAGENLEAVEARHLNIEEADVGRVRREGCDGVFGARGGADDFDAVGAIEETAQTVEG
jgi:hypothetical protein